MSSFFILLYSSNIINLISSLIYKELIRFPKPKTKTYVKATIEK